MAETVSPVLPRRRYGIPLLLSAAQPGAAPAKRPVATAAFRNSRLVTAELVLPGDAARTLDLPNFVACSDVCIVLCVNPGIASSQARPISTYDIPISSPTPNTSSPPSTTWITADDHGESMYLWRTQEITPSSTSTTATAIHVAVFTSLSK